MFSICSCLINRHPYQTGLGYVKRTKEQFIFFFFRSFFYRRQKWFYTCYTREQNYNDTIRST